MNVFTATSYGTGPLGYTRLPSAQQTPSRHRFSDIQVYSPIWKGRTPLGFFAGLGLCGHPISLFLAPGRMNLMLPVEELNPVFRLADDPVASERAIRQCAEWSGCQTASHVALVSDVNRLGLPAAGSHQGRGKLAANER